MYTNKRRMERIILVSLPQLRPELPAFLRESVQHPIH